MSSNKINTPSTAAPLTGVTTTDDKTTHVTRRVAIAAASVPVLVIGQFAMVAIIPVGMVVRNTWRHPHLRKLRPWAAGLATAYAIPLAMWAIGPDRAPSLSKDMATPFAGLIVFAAIAFLARQWSLRDSRG